MLDFRNWLSFKGNKKFFVDMEKQKLKSKSLTPEDYFKVFYIYAQKLLNNPFPAYNVIKTYYNMHYNKVKEEMDTCNRMADDVYFFTACSYLDNIFDLYKDFENIDKIKDSFEYERLESLLKGFDLFPDITHSILEQIKAIFVKEKSQLLKSFIMSIATSKYKELGIALYNCIQPKLELNPCTYYNILNNFLKKKEMDKNYYHKNEFPEENREYPDIFYLLKNYHATNCFDLKETVKNFVQQEFKDSIYEIETNHEIAVSNYLHYTKTNFTRWHNDISIFKESFKRITTQMFVRPMIAFYAKIQEIKRLLNSTLTIDTLETYEKDLNRIHHLIILS